MSVTDVKRWIIGVGLLIATALLIIVLLLVWPFRSGIDNTLLMSPLLKWPSGGAGFGTGLNANIEFRILLVVIVAGAMGAAIQLMQSFAYFVGKGNFEESWFWWYLLRLPIGSFLALALYLLIRGGFMAGSQAATAADNVNVFGIAGLSILAGLFSRQAVDKLGQVFDVVFDTDDQRRSGPADPFKNLKIEPEELKVGTTSLVLKVKGDNLKADFKVFVGTKERVLKPVGKDLEVTLLPEDVATAATREIIVQDAKGARSKPLNLTVV